MVDGFTAATGTQVAVEPTEWTAYWDKLATQTAAGDEPDVINMDGKYLAEYGARGALADLGEASGIDLSGLSQADLDAGRVDGKLHAISTGSNAFAVMANPTLFKQAGVDLPDDRTWTWDDYAEIGKQLRGGGVQGISGGGTYADLTIFLRQHGEDLFSGRGWDTATRPWRPGMTGSSSGRSRAPRSTRLPRWRTAPPRWSRSCSRSTRRR